jgi:hypothetical protein
MMRTFSHKDLPDLRALTDRWRVRRDAEHLPVIPGRRGSVSAHDRGWLCVHVRGRGFLLGLLRDLPAGWKRHQVGDDEANLLAPVGDLDHACQLVRAYRRPRLSEEQRAALAARASSNFDQSPRQSGSFLRLKSTNGPPPDAQRGSAPETVS